MAKKALVFSPAKWIPLNEAFARAEAALGSFEHALQDLHDQMRGERLRSAVRRINRDGTAVFEPLELSFWEASTLREGHGPGPDGRLRRSGTVRVHDRGEPLYSHGADRSYFVLRSDLDKLYAARAGETAAVPARVTPGPKPTDGWPTWVARWLILKAKEYPTELRNVDALVREAREFLDNEQIFLPKDDKEVRKVLVGLLLFVQR
jgi:hypothetical protein